MAGPKVFNANQVFVELFGVTISRGRGKAGYADGTFLEIEQDGPDFAGTKGSDGSYTRHNMNEPITKWTLHLMSTSDSNAVLSAMLLKDKTSPNGAGIGTAVANDLGGTSICEAEYAWVEGPPKKSYSRQGEEMAWTIILFDATRIDGGN